MSYKVIFSTGHILTHQLLWDEWEMGTAKKGSEVISLIHLVKHLEVSTHMCVCAYRCVRCCMHVLRACVGMYKCVRQWCPLLGHPSTADEARYWPNCVLCSG